MMRPTVTIVEANLMNKRLIAVIGPTGIGKTKLAIHLAQYFQTEILSADSRQFYKEMTIGTAVPSIEELAAATHHFIQHKSIFESYSVGEFEREAIDFLNEFYQNNDVAILVGGSGLYIDAVTQGLDNFPKVRPQTRVDLTNRLAVEGLPALQRQLAQLDPDYYEKVDIDNPHRVIRALEICLETQLPYSSFLNKPKPARGFKTIFVGLKAERTLLYERINQRVDKMMAEGQLNEAKRLHEHAALNALQTVGYRELFSYLDGKFDLDFAIAEIKKNTRRFAKRQMTWYRKRNDILWMDYMIDKENAIQLIEDHIKTELNA